MLPVSRVQGLEKMAGSHKHLDALPQTLNEVVVTTAKAFKAVKRDGKGNISEAAAAVETRIPAAIEKFNLALDEIECDILRAKAILLRDLNQLRANRKPAVPQQKPVAPPAPMTIDLESPKMVPKETPPGASGPQAPGKPVSKPVAPFPNMEVDSTSPEVAPAPGPKMAPRPKDLKNVARPPPAANATAAAAAAGRAASAPPKKEITTPGAQMPKPGGAVTTPQTPLTAPGLTKTASAPLPSAAAPANAPGPAGPENIFTDMTFSLAPPAGEPQPPNQTQHQNQNEAPQVPATTTTTTSSLPMPPAPTDLTNPPMAGNNASTFAAEPFPADDPASVDAKIDGLFDLSSAGMASMDLDYGIGGDGNENSNFNDLFFDAGGSSGGDGGGGGGGDMSAGEFDNAYFNLDG
ncbi:hypothetical protein VTK26DRAFT_5162 [Humicola hyalothermophila]